MKRYRDTFRPSDVLAEPYSLLSVGALAQDDAADARHQSASAAMAMLRMFQRKPYALLPPNEVAAYPATVQERNVLDSFTRRYILGTGADVADELEQLQLRTGVNEIMLVGLGHSHQAQVRSAELIADHYGMSAE